MSLRNKFKTNSKAANEGVWVDFPDQPNNDGTIPGFKLARNTTQNKAYDIAVREATKNHLDHKGVYNANNEEAKKIDMEIFASVLLLDWRNFQPDDNGKNLVYSKDNVKKIFSDPDWSDLHTILIQYLSDSTLYKVKEQKEAVKN